MKGGAGELWAVFQRRQGSEQGLRQGCVQDSPQQILRSSRAGHPLGGQVAAGCAHVP